MDKCYSLTEIKKDKMEVREFTARNLDLGRSHLKMNDGTEMSGNCSRHFPKQNPDDFFFVETRNMAEFDKQRTIYNKTRSLEAYEIMRSLAVPMDLADIAEAEFIRSYE